MAIFDVDGVLTDGRIYIGAAGESFKAFSTLDGQGLKLLARRRHHAGRHHRPRFGGGAPAHGRPRRAARGLRRGRQAGRGREPLLDGLGCGWDRVAAMGDDWPDLPIAARAPPSPARRRTPTLEVRAVAHHVTAAAAGHGAAREFCDLLLMASGRYAELLRGPLSRSMVRDEPAPRRQPRPRGADDVDLSFAGPEPVAAAPWPMRLLDLVSAYLPLLLMAVLALGHLVAGAQYAERRRRRASSRRRATSPTTR